MTLAVGGRETQRPPPSHFRGVRPDMVIAVYWDVKQRQNKQTKYFNKRWGLSYSLPHQRTTVGKVET